MGELSMPIQYVRDDANRRILVITSGEVGLDDVIGTVDQQAKDKTWSEAERWLETM
jgi:hypothetical protein